jgi:hypothetical protein
MVYLIDFQLIARYAIPILTANLSAKGGFRIIPYYKVTKVIDFVLSQHIFAYGKCPFVDTSWRQSSEARRELQSKNLP